MLVWLASIGSSVAAYFVGKKVEDNKIKKGTSKASTYDSSIVTLCLSGALIYLLVFHKGGK